MRIATYNVNSLGARLPRVLATLRMHEPDLVLLQETKCTPEAFPHRELAEAGYLAADHSGGRWAGVAVLGRATLGVEALAVGLPGEPAPEEARWVEARVGDVTAVSVYVPNGQRVGSEPFSDKLTFLEAMADRAGVLAKTGPTLIGGDMNVCLTDLDAYDPDALHGGTHATPDERRRMQAVIDTGYTDVFRQLHPTEPGYTWWDYRQGHFHKGFGLRIDLLLATPDLAATATTCGIDRDLRKPSTVPESKPSDHTVLLADLDRTTEPNPAATNDPGAAADDRAGATQLGLGLDAE